MTAFTDESIHLMQRLARDTNNAFNMTSRGYVLATRRADVGSLTGALQTETDIDVISGRDRIRASFPALGDDIRNVIHIKKGGDFSGQQLGAFMLEQYRESGGKRLHGEVTGITKDAAYSLQVESAREEQTVKADVIVNAAGPFAARVASMLGVELPVRNIFQQKITFDDKLAVIPRDMPFSIDLDAKSLGWTDEERALLAGDPDLAWLTQTMPAGTHCRPDGGDRHTWVKLGWAYNQQTSEPQPDLADEAAIDPQFPEIVIRGAAAFLPSLAPYIDAPPARFVHYGGYYTMTEENWPLIGPMGPNDTYLVGALSGFGSMSACAAGKLCAAWVCGDALPDYAADLSLARHENAALIASLQDANNKGLL